MKQIILTIAALAIAGSSFGQNERPKQLQVRGDLHQGWIYDAGFTLGGNVTRNEFVTNGAQNGNTITLTSSLLGNLNLAQPRYEWRNNLAIGLGFSRTPSLPKIVKGDDFIKLSSEFRYKLRGLTWLFPYFDASWESNLLDGVDYRTADVTYTGEGVGTNGILQDSEFKLNSGMSIHKFTQTLGAIIVLHKKRAIPEFDLEARVGIGARQNAFNGQYVISKDEDNGIVELQKNEFTSKIGAKYGLYATGIIGAKKLSYTAYAEFLSPFVTNPENDDLDIGQQTDHAFGANVSLNVTDWMALVYDFKNVRQPDVQDESQITHTFLATVALATKGIL